MSTLNDPSREVAREGQVASALGALGRNARAAAPFGARTTYRVGGPAAIGYVARNVDDVRLAVDVARAHDLDWMVAGRGSNLLVADAGYDGIVVWLEGDFERLLVDAAASSVVAGASVPLPVLARRSAAAALSGLEWAVGVPGTVGGAVAMNAGGHGSDVASCLRHAEVLRAAQMPHNDQTPRAVIASMTPADLQLGYRTSALRATDVVLRAKFSCTPCETVEAQATIRKIVRWRRDNQPGGQNAGSVFKNPTLDAASGNSQGTTQPGLSAAELIDRAGLKGLRVASARVSQMHANFIVARSGGLAADVAELIALVADRVEAASGVRLEPEVKLVGFSST